MLTAWRDDDDAERPRATRVEASFAAEAAGLPIRAKVNPALPSDSRPRRPRPEQHDLCDELSARRSLVAPSAVARNLPSPYCSRGGRAARCSRTRSTHGAAAQEAHQHLRHVARDC
jgi:hypothetical protein